MRALLVLIILAVAADWIVFKGKFSFIILEDAKYEGQLFADVVQQGLQRLGR